jgi:voltage-gated potassium channel Kch
MEPITRRHLPLVERVFGTVPGVRWLVLGMFFMSVACAIVVRLIARDDFSSFEDAFWWAIQTVTTVGYGDVTPQTRQGRVVASVLMLGAVASISLLTAAISAAFVNRLARRRMELHQDPVVEMLVRIERRLDQVEKRLEAR